LKLMRARARTMPALVLTALADSVYEEAALPLGAVDFIGKSCSLSVIMKRLSLITDGRKPATTAGTELVRREKLGLRPHLGRAFLNNKRVELTLTEFTILQTLAEMPKRDFSYREIYELVRGERFIAGWGEEGYRVNVRSFIRRIRQKFRAIDNEFDCIKKQFELWLLLGSPRINLPLFHGLESMTQSRMRASDISARAPKRFANFWVHGQLAEVGMRSVLRDSG
jgi:two-component system response regulator ChvI